MNQVQSLAIRTGFLIIVSTGTVQVAEAQLPVASIHHAANRIKFVGVENEMLVFELLLNNLPQEGSWLRITDEQGTLVFEERIKGTTLNKRYKVVRNRMTQIQFEILSKRSLLKESFHVNLRTEEKWEVTKGR